MLYANSWSFFGKFASLFFSVTRFIMVHRISEKTNEETPKIVGYRPRGGHRDTRKSVNL